MENKICCISFAAKYILTRACRLEMVSARECTCVSKAKEGKVLETFCHTNHQPTNQRNNFYPTGPDA